MADRSGLVCFLHLTRKGVVYRRPTLSIMMKIKRCIITSTRIRLIIPMVSLTLYGQSPWGVAKYQVFLLAEKQRAFF